MTKIPELGVALSLYNKINHLKTNVDIIRNHWSEKNIFISVCCNDSSIEDKIKNLKINSYVKGNHTIKSEPKAYRRLRIFDCVRNSILNCNSEYIIHYHADAYALKYETIKSIIDLMKEKNCFVAFRGRGLNYRNNKNIFGDVDDHFCIFNRKELIKSKMFDVDYAKILNIFYVGNPETVLSKLIQDSFASENIFHYSTMENNEVGTKNKDSFYKDNIMHRAMTPYNFNNNYQFLHFGDVDKNFIIDNLTKRGVNSKLIHL